MNGWIKIRIERRSRIVKNEDWRIIKNKKRNGDKMEMKERKIEEELEKMRVK